MKLQIKLISLLVLCILLLGSSNALIHPFDRKYLSESDPHWVDYFLGTALAEPKSQQIVQAVGGNESFKSTPSLDDIAALESFLDDFFMSNMASLKIPGVAFVIVKDNQLIASKGYGYADIANQIPVEPDKTIFRVGSVSKLLTAVAVMQATEQGYLDLNTDINQYLSTVQISDTYPEPVTLKQLLTHTAGFEDRIIGILAQHEAGLRSPGEFLRNYPVERVYPPGTIHSYSNYSFTLAGQLVTEASGIPFNQYVNENIFQPLDMNASTFDQPVPQDLASNMAIGYNNTGPDYEVGPDIYLQIAPAGSLSTTATDMANFMTAMLADGRYKDVHILEERTAQQIKQQQFTHHGELPGMTLGFKERYINSERLIGHGGDIDTYASQMILLPEHNIGFFMAYNTFNDALRQNFITAFMNQYFPIEATLPPPASVNLTIAELARFAGSYRWVKYPHSTLGKLSVFAPGAHNWTISVNDDATISLAPFALGAEWRYVPVEPLVFKQVSGEPLLIAGVQISPGKTLVFREGAEDEIAFAFIPLQNAAMEKLAWYEAGTIQIGVLLLATLAFLSTLIWPIGFWMNRFRQKTTSPSSAGQRAHWLAGVVCVTNLLAFSIIMMNLGPTLGMGVPTLMKGGLLLLMLTSILTLGMIIACSFAWTKRYWTIFGRIHYTIITLSALLFVWWLTYWNLLGWLF